MNFLMNLIGTPLGWVMWVAYKVIPIYSVALIIFTIIVRFAMLPLSIKQQRSTAHMALLKPKMDNIKKKYAKNPQKVQEETAKLYEEEGISPFSGCSTMLIQLPIIYGLLDVVYRPMTHLLRLPAEVIEKATKIFSSFTKVDPNTARQLQLKILGSIPEHREKFVAGLGEQVVSEMESLDLNLFGMNLGETPTWAWNALIWIPILSFVTALLTSLVTMKMTDMGANGQGKGCTYAMMFGMPLMSAYFSFLFPAGLGLYWIFSNVVAAVQSVVLRKIITPEKVLAKLEKDRAKGKLKKQSKFMKKLMDAQTEAAAQQGAYSESEKNESDEKARAEKAAKSTKGMSDSEKLAEARRRYAEKYGDEIDK